MHVLNSEMAARFVINDKTKTSSFVSVFACLKTFSDSYTFSFSEDEMVLQGMDPSHVCMFQLVITRQWFAEYEVAANTQITVSSQSLAKVLQAHDGQSIVLSYEDGADTVGVSFDGTHCEAGSSRKFAKSFTLALLSVVDHVDLTVPEFEYCAEMDMPSRTLAQLVDQLSGFADTVSIKCSEEVIELDAKGDDTSMSVGIQFDQLTTYAIDEDETVSVSFAVSFLKRLCGGQKAAESVSLKLHNSYPLFVVYDMGDESSLRFHLAPKIEDE